MRDIFILTVLLIIVAGYYSLMVMPKQRAFKKHFQYVSALKVGDQVITYGGIIATITELDVEDGVAKALIAEGVEVRLLVTAILQPYDPDEIAQNARLGLEMQQAQE